MKQLPEEKYPEEIVASDITNSTFRCTYCNDILFCSREAL